MYIRDARISDLNSIVQIYNSTVGDRMATADTKPITIDSRVSWLQNRDFRYRPVWVMETQASNLNDNKIIGWLSFNDFYGRPAYQHTAEISVYVAKDYRRQGVGSELLKKAIANCPQLQITTLLAFVFAHNQPSLDLLQNYGFESWGLLSQVAKLDEQTRDLAILGLKIAGLDPTA